MFSCSVFVVVVDCQKKSFVYCQKPVLGGVGPTMCLKTPRGCALSFFFQAADIIETVFFCDLFIAAMHLVEQNK